MKRFPLRGALFFCLPHSLLSTSLTPSIPTFLSPALPLTTSIIICTHSSHGSHALLFRPTYISCILNKHFLVSLNTFFPIYSVSKSLVHHDYSHSFSSLPQFLLSLFPSLDCQSGLRSVSLTVFCHLQKDGNEPSCFFWGH